MARNFTMRLLYLMKYPSKAYQTDPFDDDDVDDGKNEIGSMMERSLLPDGFKPLE